MVDKKVITEAARDFLWALAQGAKADLGTHLERTQHSEWVIQTSQGGRQSKRFKRRVLDHFRILMMCLTLLDQDFSQKKRLEKVLVEAGSPKEYTYGCFFVPLARNWLATPAPFTLDEANLRPVLKEFVDAVVEGKEIVRSRDAIYPFVLPGGPLELENGVSIRPITKEELWEFGDIDPPNQPKPFEQMPTEKWNIVDIEIQRQRRWRSRVPDAIFEAVLAALVIASPGTIQVAPLRWSLDYGIRDWSRSGGFPIRRLGRWGGAYAVDTLQVSRIQSSWPRIREIMESQDHYLRLPAKRLVDGGDRERPDDAILDYAIGLEVLLTEGTRDELKYRFALRGANILTWSGGNKRQCFDELQQFYDTRSSIVHGSRVNETKINSARSVGEKALRDIWWWFFAQDKPSLREATAIIDKRILG